ncbi:MAG: PAS domain-containing protein, partial [Leptolyngbyaceae cyanobacterium]
MDNSHQQNNILIVDDIPENVRLLSQALISRGYRVRGVTAGIMALRVAESGWPDLILLDIQMPEMDGYQVCEALKAEPSTQDIPVIFLTASDEILDKFKAFSGGGADYITKPFQIEEVVVRIGHQLKLQQAQTEIKQLNQDLEAKVQERTHQLEQMNERLLDEIEVRRQAEQALKQSERRLELAKTAAKIGVWDFDIAQNRLNWDQNMYELYNVDPNQFDGAYETWRHCLHPEDLSRAHDETQAAIAGKQDFHTEFRVVWPSGEIRHIEAHAIVLRNDDGTAQRMIGANWDISERVGLIAESKQSELQFQNLVTGTAAATGADFFAALVQHISESLDVPYVTVSKLVDGEFQTLAFWADGELWPNCSYSPVNTPCEQVLQEGVFYCERLVQEQFPDDVDLADLNVSSYLGVALFDSQGNAFGDLCILSPELIANPKRAEQILRICAARAAAELERLQVFESLEQLNQSLETKVEERTTAIQQLSTRLDLAVKSAAIGIWDWDILQNQVFWDQRVHDLFGTSPTDDTIDYETWARYIHPDDREGTIAALKRALTDGEDFDIEFRILRADGTLRFIQANGLVQRDSQGQPTRMIGINYDMTARTLAEQTIQQKAAQEKLLGEINQRIRQSLDLQTIFDTACHEIRPVLEADRVGVFKFYPDSAYNQGEFVAEAFLPDLSPIVGIPVTDHCFGQDYANLYVKGRYSVTNDIQQGGMSPCYADILAVMQVRACIVMPLLSGGELWGLLCVHQCRHVRQWEPGEVDLAQRFANQLAIAIQQAELYAQLEQELTERQQAQQQLTERNQQ